MPIISFFTYAFVNSFTPGPNNFMALAYANKYGFKRSLPFCLGVSIGFFTIVLLSSIFNVLLVKILPSIQLPLTVFGVIYMLYLAYRIMTSRIETKKGSDDKPNTNLLFIGVVMQFINPKAILYGITVVGTFILPYFESYMSYLFFSLLLGFIGLLSACTWSLFGSVFQQYLIKYERVFNVVMALLLVYSAISIAI